MTKDVSIKDLRRFGLTVGGIFGLIAVWPLIARGEPARWWALIAAIGLLLPATLVPAVLQPVHRIWMKAGHALGWINTRILLGIVFYGLVTPLGLIRRVLGKGSMTLAWREPAETYRHPKQVRPPSHLWHPF
jgi:polyferredoxin